MRVQSLGLEDPLEEEMATHSSVLAWRTHRQRSLAGYRPPGLTESDRTEMTEYIPLPFSGGSGGALILLLP